MRDASGILNWLIAGALDYLKNGLVVSDETRAMTKDYFDEMDPLARFVRDCVSEEPGHTVKARDMYLSRSGSLWCCLFGGDSTPAIGGRLITQGDLGRLFADTSTSRSEIWYFPK